MHDSMSVQVLNSGKHLAHDVCGLVFGESLGGHDAVEQLTALAVLHHDVHVTMVDIALVELDNIRVIDSAQNSEFLFEQFDIFSDVFTED